MGSSSTSWPSVTRPGAIACALVDRSRIPEECIPVSDLPGLRPVGRGRAAHAAGRGDARGGILSSSPAASSVAASEGQPQGVVRRHGNSRSSAIASETPEAAGMAVKHLPSLPAASSVVAREEQPQGQRQTPRRQPRAAGQRPRSSRGAASGATAAAANSGAAPEEQPRGSVRRHGGSRSGVSKPTPGDGGREKQSIFSGGRVREPAAGSPRDATGRAVGASREPQALERARRRLHRQARRGDRAALPAVCDTPRGFECDWLTRAAREEQPQGRRRTPRRQPQRCERTNPQRRRASEAVSLLSSLPTANSGGQRPRSSRGAASGTTAAAAAARASQSREAAGERGSQSFSELARCERRGAARQDQSQGRRQTPWRQCRDDQPQRRERALMSPPRSQPQWQGGRYCTNPRSLIPMARLNDGAGGTASVPQPTSSARRVMLHQLLRPPTTLRRQLPTFHMHPATAAAARARAPSSRGIPLPPATPAAAPPGASPPAQPGAPTPPPAKSIAPALTSRDGVHA